MNRRLLRKNLISLFVAASLLATGQLIAAPQTLTSNRAAQNDKPRMLRDPNGPMQLRDKSQRPLHEKVANQFAPRFGIRDPQRDLRVKREKQENNRTHIRYAQQQNGIPVFAGELIANLNAQQQLTSMSGEVTTRSVINPVPGITASQASKTALAAVARWYQIDFTQLHASKPELTIYDPSLIYDAPSSAQLVWKLNVTPNYHAPINEVVLVDAHTNGIVLHFNKIDSALNRRVYDAAGQASLPGNLLCNETPPCSGNPDAVNTHNFLEDTFDYYAINHGRDGIDNVGGLLRASVNFSETVAGGSNAFWVGAEAYLGETNILIFTNNMTTDDIVAHEYTHGVTEHESNLIYLSESGAINESLSDIWGEFVDQDNGSGDDNATTAWQIGEGSELGVIRDMSDPTIYGHPDRMTSTNFETTTFDSGGVHINSGVNNKAAYLMAAGSLGEPGPPAGTFNGETIVSMGMDKTVKLYYHVQTNYLTTGSDYFDLNNALLAACNDLVGTVMVASDCTDSVQPALRAVEMDQSPSASYAPSAEICPVGVNVYDLFADDFESNNLSNWSTRIISGTNTWQTGNINLASNSGNYTLLGHGYAVDILDGTDNDVTLETNTAVRIPSSSTAYIHFDHAYYFEGIGAFNYDGGVLEYSIDNGDTWTDAGSLIDAGRNYTGALYLTNPLPSRNAFTQFSNGFNSTRLNLSSLAGEYVLFRFRNLADEITASGPWTIDNFRIYLCADNAPPVPNAGPDQSAIGEELIQLSGSVSDPDGDTVTFSWNQVSGTPVALTGADTLTPSFTTPRTDTNMVFELIANDGTSTETDTVTVAVEVFFSGAAGGGGNGCSLNENGRFDPIWLIILLILSTLHGIRGSGRSAQNRKNSLNCQ